MSDHHHHHHDHSGPIAIGATAARVVVGLLTGIGVLVLIGAVWLWPSHQHIDIPLPMQNGGGGAVQTEAGTVTMQDVGPCGSLSNGKVFDDTPNPPPKGGYSCQRSMVAIESGPHKGKHTLLEIAPGPGQPDLHAGDHIRLVRQNDPSGAPNYSFDDYSRGMPLGLIAIVFVVVIVIVARWRGLRAVLGLVFAFGVLVLFLLPALLDGKPALPVAMVAGALILYAVLYLAHGVNLRTSSALLGTLSAMVLAAALSWLTLKITHVTGLSQEDNTNVATYVQHVSITGLLLAGFIIGSLGVLNDVTITQASAAFELAAIDEEASRREVFTAAMRVGRDHIASTVYTLVLAYAGGALPLLLMFSVAGRSITDVLTGDAVAIEITRSAVGGICLALSVPLTTGIAVLLARPFGAGGAEPEPEPEPVRRRSRAAASTHDHAEEDESPRRTRRQLATVAERHTHGDEFDPQEDDGYPRATYAEDYHDPRARYSDDLFHSPHDPQAAYGHNDFHNPGIAHIPQNAYGNGDFHSPPAYANDELSTSYPSIDPPARYAEPAPDFGYPQSGSRHARHSADDYDDLPTPPGEFSAFGDTPEQHPSFNRDDYPGEQPWPRHRRAHGTPSPGDDYGY